MPIENSIAARIRYAGDGDLQDSMSWLPSLLPREHNRAKNRDQDQDASHLERQQQLGEEQCADLARCC